MAKAFRAAPRGACGPGRQRISGDAPGKVVRTAAATQGLRTPTFDYHQCRRGLCLGPTEVGGSVMLLVPSCCSAIGGGQGKRRSTIPQRKEA